MQRKTISLLSQKHSFSTDTSCFYFGLIYSPKGWFIDEKIRYNQNELANTFEIINNVLEKDIQNKTKFEFDCI